MSDHPASEPPLEAEPVVGQEVSIAILPAPNRLTLFAETTLVTTAPDTNFEVVLLRREIVPVAQTGIVRRVVPGRGVADVEMSSTSANHVIHDIGHVRIAPTAAIDLAFSVIDHARGAGLLTTAQAVERLQSGSESVS